VKPISEYVSSEYVPSFEKPLIVSFEPFFMLEMILLSSDTSFAQAIFGVSELVNNLKDAFLLRLKSTLLFFL